MPIPNKRSCTVKLLNLQSSKASCFAVHILISQLAPFTPNEIAAARTLTQQYHARVMLLTPDELEPYNIYDRLANPLKQQAHGGSAQQLVATTAMVTPPTIVRSRPIPETRPRDVPRRQNT